ncbi:MAG: hypothetical protein AB9915_00605 [Candidatus Dojkabacteria bacterium]
MTPEEEQNKSRIPEEYKSGFTFFANEVKQRIISQFTPRDFVHFLRTHSELGAKLAYELWRTGRLELLYEAFMEDEVIADDDFVDCGREMVRVRDVSPEECRAFFTAIACVSANVRDEQELGAEVLPQRVNVKVEKMMGAVEE